MNAEELDVLALVTAPLGGASPLVAVVVLVWAFGVGSTLGSFLNVVIYRVPRGQSVRKPKRSHCPHCGVQIAWFDNIPVFSWIALRGRCRKCGGGIAFRYPFVEALIGLLLMGVAYRYGLGVQGWLLFAFAVVLIAIAYIDLDYFFIPWSTLIALTLVGVVALVFELATGQPAGTVIDTPLVGPEDGEGKLLDLVAPRLIGGFAGFAVFMAFKVLADVIARITKRIGPDEEAMGLGDPLLVGAIGLFLGWQGLPLVIFLGSLQGSIAGIALRISGRLHRGGLPESNRELIEAEKKAQEEKGEGGEAHPLEDDSVPPGAVPFGPFLALGALEVAFFGPTWVPSLYRLFAFPGF